MKQFKTRVRLVGLIRYTSGFETLQFLVYKAQHDATMNKPLPISSISAPCMFIIILPVPETDVILLALPSTDSWIESMIVKKQKKKGTLQNSEPVTESEKDPFEELNCYLKQPWLRRKDCPNPISWWGVSTFII